MLGASGPRMYTFLSAVSNQDKFATMVNLAATVAKAGGAVSVVSSTGLAGYLGQEPSVSITEACVAGRGVEQAFSTLRQGFELAVLCRPGEKLPDQAAMKKVSDALETHLSDGRIGLFDASVDAAGEFQIEAMAKGDIVVQLMPHRESVMAAYALMKRLSERFGRRPFSVLVTGADEAEAKQVFDNVAQTASRFISVPVRQFGAIPADPQVGKASRLGRTVVDAFPTAPAASAFRRVAEQFFSAETSGAGSGRNNATVTGAA